MADSTDGENTESATALNAPVPNVEMRHAKSSLDVLSSGLLLLAQVIQVRVWVLKLGLLLTLLQGAFVMFLFWLAQMHIIRAIGTPPFALLVSVFLMCDALTILWFGASWLRAERKIAQMMKTHE